MRTSVVGVAVVAAMLAACNKDPPPKPIQDEPKKTTPVPSDMVFNDFIPAGGPGGGLAVRVDGGLLEGGLVGGDGGAVAATEGEARRAKLLEPGAEPRVARRYAFVANRNDKRVFTLRQSMSMAGRTQEQPGLAMTVDLVPKDVKPKATRFDLKVVKVELADQDKLPPQMVQQAAKELGGFGGLAASFEVTPQGTVGELSMAGTPKMARDGAEELLQSLQQLVELIVVPLPDEAIGVGAKWEVDESGTEAGIKQTGKRVLELKEMGADGTATIATTIERKVAKRPVPDPRAKGATMEVDAKGGYTYAVKFDHIASKVNGELTQTIKIEAPAGDNGEKRTVVQEQKLKQVMEPAK